MWIVGLAHHTLGNLIVETEVKDSVHHTRHGSAGTRTYADKKRILYITELGVHEGFNVLYGSINLIVEQFLDTVLSNLIIFVAAISSDGKAWRHRNTD